MIPILRQSPCRSTWVAFELLIGLCFMKPLRAGALEYPSMMWTNRLGVLSDSSPAVGPDGTIYAGSFAGNLWALNPSGSVKWKFRAGLEIKSSPAVAADGTIYFGSRDRKIYALTSAGREKWHFDTGAWVDSSAAIGSDGTVYFGSWDKSFYALRPDGL